MPHSYTAEVMIKIMEEMDSYSPKVMARMEVIRGSLAVVDRSHPHPPDLRPPSCPECRRHRRLLDQQQNNNLKVHTNESMAALKFIWRAPQYGMLKLNTDGSSRGNPGPSSFGGLIRDCNGNWLGGYMGKMKAGSYTSLEAEVYSIFAGLHLIKKKNMSGVLIETDCLAILRLGVHGWGKNNHFKCVMEAIHTVMIEQRCVMIHTRRDGNHSADQLAKLGHQCEGYKELEQPPSQLLPYLLRDIEAAWEAK